MKIILLCLILGVITNAASANDEFKLFSKVFHKYVANDQLYNGHGYSGKNISPDLTWSNPPPATKSFAITMFDPDAPRPGGWWHWLIFDIPANVTSLPADAGNIKRNLAPAGSIQSITSFHKAGYGGSAPPKGSKPHRYIITVYALNTATLNLTATTPPLRVVQAIKQHQLAKASLTAYYPKPKE